MSYRERQMDKGAAQWFAAYTFVFALLAFGMFMIATNKRHGSYVLPPSFALAMGSIAAVGVIGSLLGAVYYHRRSTY